MRDGRRHWVVAFGAMLFFGGGAFFASQFNRGGLVVADEIQLIDREGRTRATLKTGAHGEPGLALVDGEGKTRLTAGLSETGEPSVNFLNAQGGLVWRSSAAIGPEAVPLTYRGEARAMTWKIESAAFEPMASIPTVHTCEGKDLSPPLSWNSPPPGTRSLALIVDDPDAPDPQAPRVTWVHWVLYNLPPDSSGLAQGIQPNELPSGTRQGLNDWKRTGYGGPCPPVGRHRYFFKLYALDRRLEDLGSVGKRELEQAMEGHIVAKAELIGTYQKAAR